MEISQLSYTLIAFCTLLAAWIIYREITSRAAKRSDTQSNQDWVAEIEIVQYNLSQEISENKRSMEALEARISKIELEMTELHEFVHRNMRKMTSRNSRAESLWDLMEQSKEIDQAKHHTPVNQSGRPKIVRKQ